MAKKFYDHRIQSDDERKQAALSEKIANDILGIKYHQVRYDHRFQPCRRLCQKCRKETFLMLKREDRHCPDCTARYGK